MYKLTNIQLEYETIRSKQLADEATSFYTNGKEFAYDQIVLEEAVEVNRGTESRLNYRVNPQRRSLKGILLLFIVPYTAGARDSENYLNSDITKVNVTINSSPTKVLQRSISGIAMWDEVRRFFGTKSKSGGNDRPNMNFTKYLTDNKFGPFIDLRSMADTSMHGNGQRLVNTKDGVHLAIKRNTSGSGKAKCHIFTTSDSQMNIMERQLQAVQY